MFRIERITASQVKANDQIIEEDDPSLDTDHDINFSYVAGQQDWTVVDSVWQQADRVVLHWHYEGEQEDEHTAYGSPEQIIWRLVVVE